MIEIEHLTKDYSGLVVVDDVSLTIGDGCAILREHWDRLVKYADSIVHDLSHVAEHGAWSDVREETRRTLDWIERTRDLPPGAGDSDDA